MVPPEFQMSYGAMTLGQSMQMMPGLYSHLPQGPCVWNPPPQVIQAPFPQGQGMIIPDSQMSWNHNPHPQMGMMQNQGAYMENPHFQVPMPLDPFAPYTMTGPLQQGYVGNPNNGASFQNPPQPQMDMMQNQASYMQTPQFQVPMPLDPSAPYAIAGPPQQGYGGYHG